MMLASTKSRHGGVKRRELTELLLDDLEDLLLVKLLGQSLNCSQSFTTIALCGKRMSACYSQ